MTTKVIWAVVIVFVLVAIYRDPITSAGYVRQGVSGVDVLVTRVFDFFGTVASTG